MKKRKRPLPPTLTVATETSPTPPITKRHDFKGDPLWNTRRLRLDTNNILFFFALFGSMAMGPEMAAVIAPATVAAIVALSGLYFGISEWGRINGVLGTTVTTETSVSTVPPGGPKE